MKTQQINKLLWHKEPEIDVVGKHISLNVEIGNYQLIAFAVPENLDYKITIYDEVGEVELSDDNYNYICKYLEEKYTDYMADNSAFTQDDYLHFINLTR